MEIKREAMEKTKREAAGTKKGLPPKKTAKNAEKEVLPKSTSSSSIRSLRQKQIKPQDISFSSIDDADIEPAAPKRRNLKRVSDEDFDPGKERAQKKMKVVQETKIPVRSTRRKLEDDKNKNLSPLQKVANGVSSRFKNMAENITSKMASPRLTRGRKKLYNPDSTSSLKSDKVSKGKKV